MEVLELELDPGIGMGGTGEFLVELEPSDEVSRLAVVFAFPFPFGLPLPECGGPIFELVDEMNTGDGWGGSGGPRYELDDGRLGGGGPIS